MRRSKRDNSGLFQEAGWCHAMSRDAPECEKMKKTYTVVRLPPRFQRSQFWKIHPLHYFNEKYEGGGEHQKTNTQTPLGFLGATETKLSHLTVIRMYGGQ